MVPLFQFNKRFVLEVCLKKKSPGAPVVISAVTLESINEVTRLARDLNLSLEFNLITAGRSVPVAKKYNRYDGLNPVHLFTLRDAP